MERSKKHSRKITFLVAILILLAGVFLGGYLVLKSGRVAAGQLDDILKGSPVDPATCSPNPSEASADADNDGLKDWQEIQVYQSDACKQDSDNDGYLDGEEIASGYDPAKKAPGDELPGTTPKTPRPLPDNLTRALSAMLAQQIVSGKIESFSQQGQILSAYELEKYPALQQSIGQIMSAGEQLFTPEIIDASQIKTSNDNSRAAIIKYAGEAANALAYEKNPEIQTSANEAEMFQKAIETNDLAELDFNLNNLNASYAKLKGLTVPNDLLPLHKEQLNIFSALIKTYEAVRSANEDPLKANLALQKYEETSAQFSNWLQKLADFVGERQ